MKKIVIFILFIISFGCEKQSKHNIEMTCEFTFVDVNGIDVFGTDSLYQLNFDDFSITPIHDDHGGYIHMMYNEKNIFQIHIYQDEEFRGTNYARTLIKFGNINVDTLKAEIAETTHTTYIKRLWYNNKELQIHTDTTFQRQCLPQVVIFKPDNN